MDASKEATFPNRYRFFSWDKCMMTSSNGNIFALLASCEGNSPITASIGVWGLNTFQSEFIGTIMFICSCDWFVLITQWYSRCMVFNYRFRCTVSCYIYIINLSGSYKSHSHIPTIWVIYISMNSGFSGIINVFKIQYGNLGSLNTMAPTQDSVNHGLPYSLINVRLIFILITRLKWRNLCGSKYKL